MAQTARMVWPPPAWRSTATPIRTTAGGLVAREKFVVLDEMIAAAGRGVGW